MSLKVRHGSGKSGETVEFLGSIAAPKEHPILFSAPMIRALLAGRPHITRRLSPQWLKVKAGDRLWVRETWAAPHADKSKQGRVAYDADGTCGCWCGHGEDRMFMCHGRVMQASGYRECFPGVATTWGLANYTDIRHGEYPSYRYGWRPSIHMPRWASRILLECEEDARSERLQDISHTEIKAEGFELVGNYRAHFRDLWGQLHTKPGARWEDNPEVVRVGKFRVITGGPNA